MDATTDMPLAQRWSRQFARPRERSGRPRLRAGPGLLSDEGGLHGISSAGGSRCSGL